MPLLGPAAMLLTFDVAAEAIAEHDDWHTHEHLPERLSIPGFLRGSRWTAVDGQPRYCVLYEVADVSTLTSEAYLQRLNHPTPWTSAMMTHYRHMSRGLCAVTAGAGVGIGNTGLVVHFKPVSSGEASLRAWLRGVLGPLASKAGIASVHLLERAATAPMTREQRLRGADASVDWVVFAMGYDADALGELAGLVPDDAALQQRGATAIRRMRYRLDYTLTADDVRERT